MRYFVLLAMLATLAACSSPEERAAKEAQKEISECTEAGYKPDTPGFEDCRDQVKAREEAKTAARIKAASDIPTLRQDSTLPGGINIPLR